MTDTEAKALALVNEVFMERCLVPDIYTNRAGNPYHEALCRAIEQHEALKREVSDAVDALKKVLGGGWHQCSEAQMCDRFILPKPDPLVEAIRDMALTDATQEDADRLRAALAARGGKIVWGDDQ